MIKLFNAINDYCLYLLVFSITFENWDPFNFAGSLSITYLSTILYLGSWAPLIAKNFHFKPFKKFVIPLLLLIMVGFTFSAIYSEYVEEMKMAYNYRALLLIVLMTFIAAHLYVKPKTLPIVLNSYIASMLLVFLLVSLGKGVTYVNGRLLIFEENPNVMGAKATLAFLITISKLINNFSFKRSIIIIPICIPFISLIAMSGSRGAFVSMFLGLAVLLYFRRTGALNKLAVIVFGALGSAMLITYLLQTNPIMAERMSTTVETGDIGRNVLWAAAFNIIMDNPIIGAGFEGVKPRMYTYSGAFMNPHNIFLYVYISCGLPGIILWITFLVRLTKLLFLHFKKYGDSLNLVLLVSVVFNMSKQGGSIGKTFFWFIFALLLGSTVHLIAKKGYKEITE